MPGFKKIIGTFSKKLIFLISYSMISVFLGTFLIVSSNLAIDDDSFSSRQVAFSISGGSLPEGTLIHTQSGTLPVEDISIKTKVYSYNLNAETWGLSEVTETISYTQNRRIITISGNLKNFSVTETHPLLVFNGNNIKERALNSDRIPDNMEMPANSHWIIAGNIQKGDDLLCHDGSYFTVKKITRSSVKQTFYNLTVSKYHNYAIGINGISAADQTLEPTLKNSGIITDSEPEHGLSGGSEKEPESYSGGCFPAGTLVYSKSGPKPIETIRSDDKVWAYQAETKKWHLQTVTVCSSHFYQGKIIKLFTEKGKLTVTPTHPFFVRKKNSDNWKWTKAGSINKGDKLLAKDGNKYKVESIHTNYSEKTVYNITIDSIKTYAVSRAGFVVHNKGAAEEPAPKADRSAPAKPESLSETGPRPESKSSSRKSMGKPPGSSGESGLRAGFADDNKQFNYFLGFLSEYASAAPHIPIDVTERIILQVKDSKGKSLPNSNIAISAQGAVLAAGQTYSDGSFYFFPSEHNNKFSNYTYRISYNGEPLEGTFSRNGPRHIDIEYQLNRPSMQSVPVDIVFIMDTTGSMSEEIERLKSTIEIIYMNLSALSTQPAIRFGMILYKDRGDIYTTRTVGLTGNLEQFQSALNEVSAEGGGDHPEDLQAALKAALSGMNWNTRGIRLGYIITDAPPHLDYQQKYTYKDGVHNAREKGIKLYTVGTGGLNIAGEYVLRQISQYTGARYIFLTYGEQGESEGGKPGSVSHHTGANYNTERLESIIIRFSKEEIQNLTDQPVKLPEEYFSAKSRMDENKKETLSKLFSQTLGQLIDYSTIALEDSTPTAVLPVMPQEAEYADTAEYFTQQLELALTQSEKTGKKFSLIERRNLQAILEEIEIQLSGLSDPEYAAEAGSLMGADLLINSTLYKKNGEYEMFFKLLRVKTAEVLSVSKAVIDSGLGL